MIDRRTIVRSVVGLPFMAASTGCGVLSPRGTMRFRMTVEAGEPGDVRRGSGVLRVVASHALDWLPETHAASIDVTGEAVTVNLESGPFFVLRRNSIAELGIPVVVALDPSTPKPGTSERVDAFIAKMNNLAGHRGPPLRAVLPRDQWPLMVRFSNISDPTSILVVDPDEAGVNSVAVETTTDPVTEGLVRHLNWLPSYRAPVYLGIKPNSRLHLHVSDFSTEI